MFCVLIKENVAGKIKVMPRPITHTASFFALRALSWFSLMLSTICLAIQMNSQNNVIEANINIMNYDVYMNPIYVMYIS